MWSTGIDKPLAMNADWIHTNPVHRLQQKHQKGLKIIFVVFFNP